MIQHSDFSLLNIQVRYSLPLCFRIPYS